MSEDDAKKGEKRFVGEKIMRLHQTMWSHWYRI